MGPAAPSVTVMVAVLPTMPMSTSASMMPGSNTTVSGVVPVVALLTPLSNMAHLLTPDTSAHHSEPAAAGSLLVLAACRLS